MIAQKGRPRAGICGEGSVYVLFKHSKFLAWKCVQVQKHSQSDLCRWNQWNLSMWSVSVTATPKALCPKEGIFSRRSGGSMDSNNEICLTGELLANLCHGDFSITLA